jgi:putative CocE/NonD family hydrolase
VRLLRDQMVRMRDGVRLATDVYMPGDAATGQPLPVIMERTPYDKQGVSRSEITLEDPVPMTRESLARYFAARGYAVVMQDCRGRYRSEGTFTKYLDEARDGFDAMAWLLDRPWCNGSVGTMGLSYGAHTQCALACLDPPGLACMFMDSGGFASAYHGGIRRGGAFELKQATWAWRHALLSPATRENPDREAELRKRDIRDWFRSMPWSPGRSPLAAAPEYEAYLFEQWREGRFSDYWKQLGLYAEGHYERFADVPTAIVGSWYDPYVLTCISNYIGLSARKLSPINLVMGPWTHGDRSATFSGDVDFGTQATLDHNVAADYRELRLQWFDRWLKSATEQHVLPPVMWFQMGGGSGARNAAGRLQHDGEWKHANAWPPPGAIDKVFYLQSDGQLFEDAETTNSILEYRYDPEDPVPTIGGALTSGEPVMRGGAFDQRTTDAVFRYRDDGRHRPLADRQDVLVFQTEPLGEAIIVTGDINIDLYVSSDCPDTDFTAKLIDVYPPSGDYPQGFAMNVTDGIFRMRYRNGWDTESIMRPGEIYQVTIKPFAASNLFARGHRLRIDISSSNYPQFDLNPNTGAAEGHGGPFQVATNRIHVGAVYPSCVRLPLYKV